MACEVLAGQEEAIVDSWRAIIGGQEHRVRGLFAPTANPTRRTKAAVRQ